MIDHTATIYTPGWTRFHATIIHTKLPGGWFTLVTPLKKVQVSTYATDG